MKVVINRFLVILFLGILSISIPIELDAQLDSLLRGDISINTRNLQFDEEKLAVYLEDEDFIYTEAEYEENTLQAFIRRFRNWLFRTIGKGINSDIVQYLLIAAAALFLVWFLLKSEKYGIIKRRDTKQKRYVEELDIRVHEDILQQKYEEAKNSRSWREALRYAYLMSLKSLDAENIIQWKEWKLSADYQEELKDTHFKRDFEKLTSFFNFGWYGKRKLDKFMFNEIEKTYKSLSDDIKKGKG